MYTRIQREKQKVELLISFTPGLRAQNSAPVRLATESTHPSASIQSRADPYIFICSTLVLYGTYGLTKFRMPQFYFFHWNLLTNYILNLVSPLRYYRKY